jgi:hypothetical protein
MSVTTKFVTVAPKICGPPVLNLLLYTLLSPENLRRLLDFWKKCAHLHLPTIRFLIICSCHTF